MSKHGTDSLRRPSGKRRFKKLFLISSEGEVTEPTYFSAVKELINKKEFIVEIKCIIPKNSSPSSVLSSMKSEISISQLDNNDEAWLVVDKDKWEQKQLKELFNWSCLEENYHLAVSNPKFEYWLLLHFEDVGGLTASSCGDKLEKYLPGYRKCPDKSKFTIDKIREAAGRARKRDRDANGHPENWPSGNGSTVYRLVEKLIANL